MIQISRFPFRSLGRFARFRRNLSISWAFVLTPLLATLFTPRTALCQPVGELRDGLATGVTATSLQAEGNYIWCREAWWQERRIAVLASPLADMGERAREVIESVPAPRQVDTFEERIQLKERMEALVIVAALYDDQEAGFEAGELALQLLDHETSDLGKAAIAQHVVVAYAFSRQWWEPETRTSFEHALLEYGKSFYPIGDGNPDNPFNNWWGVTHSGAGLCFLAVAPVFPEEALPRLERQFDRIRSYLYNYGEQGHYYEGTGYGVYSFANWGPFILACEAALGATDGWGLDAHNPGIRELGKMIYAMSISPGDDPLSNRRIFWNDDGGGFFAPSLASLWFATSDPSEKAGLKAAYDRHCGPLGDGSYLDLGSGHGHGMWTLLYYPLDVEEVPYGDRLPTQIYDQKTGLAIFRDRYQDASDTVFGVYAKSFHGGGHEHADAGSFRLSGLGAGWGYAGGQAKPDGFYQNVLLKNGEQPPGKDQKYQTRTGRVIYYSPRENGGSISVDLGQVYGSPLVRRHFATAFRPSPEVNTVLAIWDEIIEKEDNEWSWTLCFENHLELEMDEPGQAFTLTDPRTNASLRVHFQSTEPLKLESHQGPSSRRTFSSGQSSTYPGSRYITASCQAKSLDLLTVMTLQAGEAPDVVFPDGEKGPHARVGADIEIQLDRSRWFNGPLRISAPEDSVMRSSTFEKQD